jgi:hypothetical protein
MDSINNARDFFINQQGLSPDQADMIVSQGLQAYNQQTQPQSMMTMASGGIARLGYQMGGLGTMPMDYGQSLQIPQQPAPNFSSAQNITMNPLLNYGQPGLGTAGGTPLMMRGGGIARLGYQMGGEAIMQPQMNEQQALETIILLLIEQGIPPEQALQLAAQILQIFAQGGEPAVEEFANQLEQEEIQAMASGGIAGYAYRQGYKFGKIVKSVGKAVSGVVKGVAKAVKSVAKSPIGRIALTIGANMLLPGAGTAFGAALQSAAVNLGLQAIGGRKINPLEALAAGASGYFGFSGPTADAAVKGATATVDGVNATTKLLAEQGILANPNIAPTSFGDAIAKGVDYGATEGLRTVGGVSELTGQIIPKGMPGFVDTVNSMAIAPGAGAGTQLVMPGAESKGILQTLQDKATGFFKSPLDTVKSLGTSALDYAKKEPGTALAIAGGAGVLGGLGLGSLAGPKRDDESDDEYAQRLQKASPYLRQYYMNLNPGATPAQIEQFVAANTAEYRADGGIIGYSRSGYAGAGMVSPRSSPNPMAEKNDLAIQLFGRPLHQLTPTELEQLENYIREKFGKTTTEEETTFAARGGSIIPPARQIEGGIIELDARKTGGYIPYGKKERVDDVPAMLAKDEFVFTSRAVKAAGGGSARRGAAKMYALMKKLEAKGARV